MKDSELIFSVKEAPEGARALGHAIFTQAESMDELREMVRDAGRCYLDSEAVPQVRILLQM